MDASQIGKRAWSYAGVLQDAGLSTRPTSCSSTTDSLPPPEVIAAEIADDLEAALAQFTKIAARLGG